MHGHYANATEVKQQLAAPAPPKSQSQDAKNNRFKHNVAKVTLSTLVPKVLVCAALLLFFFLCLRAAGLFLDVSIITQLDGFGVFLGSLDTQLNQTNWYVTDQAAHFNNVTMTIYEGQMRSELLNLQSMLEYFNSGQ